MYKSAVRAEEQEGSSSALNPGNPKPPPKDVKREIKREEMISWGIKAVFKEFSC